MAKAPERAVADVADESAPNNGGVRNLVVMGMLGLVAMSIGFALPQLLAGGGAIAHNIGSRDSARKAETKHDSSGSHPAFVSFGELVVNLAEDRLTRYLRVSITLQAESDGEQMLRQVVDKKKTILKNWLISYLSDKSLEEVRGAAGLNRARREIQDQFNSLLFPDGSEIIRDVLFEEFSVQ